MKITFLEATNGVALSKQISRDGIKNYPMVKNVTSHEHTIAADETGLMTLEQYVRDYSNKGYCLLKGNLREPLTNESRAKKTDRMEYTQLLVLDIDKLLVPNTAIRQKNLNSGDVQSLAEKILDQMPPAFQETSYIAQASASFGLDPSKVSIHIFMFLTVPMPPKALKLWLQYMNYETELFKNNLALSSNGQSLAYPLDVSISDNSKTVFIAPPIFDPKEDDPFDSKDDRIVLVKRKKHHIDLAVFMNDINPESCHQQSVETKTRLRSEAGLSKKNSQIKNIKVGMQIEEVLQNPDKMSITIADDTNLPYIRCNVNGGDSNAYYFKLNSPTYMYNFKGEPIFSIEKADQDFYLSIFEMYEEKQQEMGISRYPVVMRDFSTDTYYNGLFDPVLDQFSDDFPLTPTTKGSVESFMLSHGHPPPDFIPEATIFFDPTAIKNQINMTAAPYWVNMYRRTEYFLQAENHKKKLKYGDAHKLKKSCPLVYTIVSHILGNGEEEFERFINWMAYIFQTRQKTTKAWVLGGVQGTGKGIFYSKVLRPLFGSEHVPMRTLRNIEENFNLYMRHALFLIVDEFHMASASTGIKRVADQLKSDITDEAITIRAMRSNQTSPPNYTNYIFLTNRPDAVNLEVTDRRYNIPPRQETALEEAHPEVIDNLDKVEEELYGFAGILHGFKYDKYLATRVAIDNAAKEQMRVVSMSVFEEFCSSIKTGDLGFFADVLEINPTNVMDGGRIMTAQRYVKAWIADRVNDASYSIVPAEHLRAVYHVMTEHNPIINQRQFKKQLNKNHIDTENRKRPALGGRDTNPVRGVVIKWITSEKDANYLAKEYFEEEDSILIQMK
ncbi:uncharacterized protein METZ01_LOCUS124434 [marine metagenome]|uniref:NrS-1 polymerase-like helicase domain-containing protein n=1 Tax=marine metagenome TaxID=408172 RepID=A0A381Y3W9_9ZZZZ